MGFNSHFLCVTIFIQCCELDEWTVGMYSRPFVVLNYNIMYVEKKVVVWLLQGLGDGVKLALVAARIVSLCLTRN